MYYHGSFVSQRGDVVTIHIVTGRDRATEAEIGSDESGLYFSDDPCEITAEVNDTFDVLLTHSATIHLLARNYEAGFFSSTCRDAVVNIYRGDECVFAGFVEPQAYSQPFNDVLDEVELSCVDALSALQYANYKHIGAAGVNYDTIRAAATQRTFAEIIAETLTDVCADLDIVGQTAAPCVLYDGSKAVSADADAYSVLRDISVSDLLFLDKDEDSVWQQDKVVTELLRFLDLHAEQRGLTFYLFDWRSVKGDGSVSWQAPWGNTAAETAARPTIEIANAIAVDTDTKLNVGDVYNQLSLTCRLEDMENLIESPLDKDNLTSPYTNRQKYCTEFSIDTAPDAAGVAFSTAKLITAIKYYEVTDSQETMLDGNLTVTDWYVRVKQAKGWEFPYMTAPDFLVTQYFNEGINQQYLPNYLSHDSAAAIISLGSAKLRTDPKDNSLVSKIDMNDYLVIGVNGNENDSYDGCFPNEQSLLKAAPMAVYKGNAAGGVFSPDDHETVNYIVISGNIALNPILHQSASYYEFRQGKLDAAPEAVPSRTGEKKKRVYTRKYYKAEHPEDATDWDQAEKAGLMPFSTDVPQFYEFKFGQLENGNTGEYDSVDKVAVIACMLIIGDKCVVESGTKGTPDDFEWRTYKPREACKDDDEYYAQCFTIGFDPKVGDFLIGTEFEIQNNISYKLGLDTEGMAIPIRLDDRISGAVRFEVLGPVNTIWNEYTRRHHTWFRSEKYSKGAVPLLAHVSAIYLKSLEIKLVSDDGQFDLIGDDKDVVYMSDSDERYVNKKDDLEFNICSALTLADRKRLGVKGGLKLSTPLNVKTGEGVREIYDRIGDVSAHPEQLYIDSYWREWHQPRVVMEQNVADTAAAVSPLGRYTHPALPGKAFYPIGIGRNLIEGSASLMLKETDV